MSLAIGDPAPEFELPDTEGRTHALADVAGAPATVVFWTCNHCPYALAWHDRLVEAGRDYADRGVRFFAINSNDAERHPADSYQAMQERVSEEDWPFPYLHDESQETALAWGAERTPELFVLDGEQRLRYRGAADADYDDPSHGAAWLRDALDRVLGGEAPEPAQTEAVGCTIKWK